MPLTQAALATKIQAEIVAQFGAPADASILLKFANAIAKAVVDEIQANAVTSTTVSGGSSAGTYPGTVG